MFLFSISAMAADSTKVLQAIRVEKAPKIDGILDEEEWKNAPIADGFKQNLPDFGANARYKTEVKIIYDDYAVYIAAMMYDDHPDSILTQLGLRDEDNLNADFFGVGFDCYNLAQDGFVFGVRASGVQQDFKFSDDKFDAVWWSAAKINEKGWVAEMKIPYFAIRFPSVQEQIWGLHFRREIRRFREEDDWVLLPPENPNPLSLFGKLKGLKDIKTPVRLSLTPYVSGYAENTPAYREDGTATYANNYSYSAGADIKYGIDDKFTLDMTLFPDFGQVQSDKKVKNISYQEVIFEENRPFFKEAVELFDKDKLFYSRRIGRTPTLFYDVPYMIGAKDEIIKNPSQAKLLNATKLSGRTNGGLGIGFFNALTDNMYAVIKDSTGNESKILTEPLTNYNVLVLDQQLKNASSVYLINTNVSRSKDWDDSNVTGAGVDLKNKKNTFQFIANGALSQLYTRDESSNAKKNIMGYKYTIDVNKLGGNFEYGFGHDVKDNNFYAMDMGFFHLNSLVTYDGYVRYRLLRPYKNLIRSNINIETGYTHHYETKKMTGNNINLNSFLLTKSFFAFFFGGGTQVAHAYDYFEARHDGFIYETTPYYFGFAGISSDYRKKIAVDASVNTGNFYKNNNNNFPTLQGYGMELGFLVRVNDKLSFNLKNEYGFDPYNPGSFYNNIDEYGNIIFGARKLYTLTNTLTAKYLFSHNTGLSLNARHYWSRGKYFQYFTLLENGRLSKTDSYTGINDFNSNFFNIDLVYSWIISPGSSLLITYKNAIATEDIITTKSFGKNFNDVIQSPQTNSISIKLLYFIDYNSIFKKKKK